MGIELSKNLFYCLNIDLYIYTLITIKYYITTGPIEFAIFLCILVGTII